MKKILLLLILSCGQLVALDKESTLKFYQHILPDIVLGSPVFLYVEDLEYKSIFTEADKISLVNSMKKSDIILVTSKEMLKEVLYQKDLYFKHTRKPFLFATDYHILKACSDVIGAFYWKKGRAQLLFVKNRLKEHNIELSQEYKKFIIDEL